ncbi:MAG: HAD family hydrolase [Cyanobacteria bacterium]|nr:HAD family hydrolase [Cyanobacteriota bacterium]
MEPLQKERRLILGTDLDGTFLGGDRPQRQALYRWIAAHRDRVVLVFVTGRDRALIEALYGDGDWPDLPAPDYAIGDVGTTVTDWRTGQPVAAVQDWIAHRWGSGSDRVAVLLDGLPGLRRQPGSFQYRRSYFCEDAATGDRAIALAQAAGYGAILSDGGQFLDILPPGVSKGPTFLRLLETLGHGPADAIVAGDTLNDWSLLTCGVPAIAVGNREPALTQRLSQWSGQPPIYPSPQPGAAGILDGLRHWATARVPGPPAIVP